VRSVVVTLAVDPADRMDWREIEHVEAHCADRRQPGDDMSEGAMRVWIARLRAGEELVPAAKAGGAALGLDGKFYGMLMRVGPYARSRHQLRRGRRKQQPAALFRVCLL